MTLWLVRTGRHGEYLPKFLNDNRIYLTWGDLDVDLSKVSSKADLSAILSQRYAGIGAVKLANHTGQIWRFTHELAEGDWVVVPDKNAGAINIVKITRKSTKTNSFPRNKNVSATTDMNMLI